MENFLKPFAIFIFSLVIFWAIFVSLIIILKSKSKKNEDNFRSPEYYDRDLAQKIQAKKKEDKLNKVKNSGGK